MKLDLPAVEYFIKHIVIGDLHGKDVWREVDVGRNDRVVFLGGYVDDFFALKKKYPEKVVLLLGNHDVQYMFYPHYRTSGFRDSMRRSLGALFNFNHELFQVAYQCGNYFFTHAGLTNA